MKFFYFILLVELITADIVTDQTSEISTTYRLPAEWEPHERILMAWPRIDVKGDNKYLIDVRQDIAYLANVISQFVQVVIFADPAQVTDVEEVVKPNVQVVGIKVDDYRTRDMSPVFVYKQVNGTESISGVVFNFNGWGKKQNYENDGQFAKKILNVYELESITTKIVAEGGAFETDGKGTLLATKSCLVNENRNNQTIDEIENELKKVLGIKKIIWFESQKGEDLTDGHIYRLVRFIRPGVVLLSRPYPGTPVDWYRYSDLAYNVLINSTDADGNPFEIIEISQPNLSRISEGHARVTSYLNFFIGNKFVAIPEYGDRKTDLDAQNLFREQFPGKQIIPILIDAITVGGGGINCALYQFPAASKAGRTVTLVSLLSISSPLVIGTSLLFTLKILNNFTIF